MHLHKIIPTGAGLGGGSADGAFTLLLLNKRYHLNLTENQITDYALQLGSDCPFFIRNRPCLAKGRGELMEELDMDLSDYRLAIINPGIHINTGWAFSRISPQAGRPSLREAISGPIGNWKDVLRRFWEAFSKAVDETNTPAA